MFICLNQLTLLQKLIYVKKVLQWYTYFTIVVLFCRTVLICLTQKNACYFEKKSTLQIFVIKFKFDYLNCDI